MSAPLAGSVSQPTVVTYHSDIVRQTHLSKAYSPYLKWFLRKADLIVTTSPKLRDNSKHLDEFSNKCEVVPIGVDLKTLREPGQPFDIPISENLPIILFVGRLNYYKGVEYLIEAMQDVEAGLLIIGDGPKFDKLVSLTQQYGLSNRIHFLGEVSDSQLRYCYEVSDIFCLPSIAPSEAFGIAQVEAMAHGLPIVNTDLPTGVPWVSQHGNTGLTVPPENADTLSTALSTLVSNSDKRETLGVAARKRVEEEFDKDTMISRMRDIYRSLDSH